MKMAYHGSANGATASTASNTSDWNDEQCPSTVLAKLHRTAVEDAADAGQEGREAEDDHPRGPWSTDPSWPPRPETRTALAGLVRAVSG